MFRLSKFVILVLVAIIGAGLSGITSLGDIVVLAVSSVVAVIGVGLILDAVNAW